MATPPGYYSLFPRGPGASSGPMPDGYIMVSRWIDATEAQIWMRNGGTYIPPQLGAGGRLYVTSFGGEQPPGTGPIRIDFGVPNAALQVAGQSDWKQIMQPVANVPVYNVSIHVPQAISESKITPDRQVTAGNPSGSAPSALKSRSSTGLGGAGRRVLSNQAAMAIAGQMLGAAIQAIGDYGIQRQIKHALETNYAQAITNMLNRGEGVLVIIRLQEWETPDLNGMRARGLLSVQVESGPTQDAALAQWRSAPRLFAGPAPGWRVREEYSWIAPIN